MNEYRSDAVNRAIELLEATIDFIRDNNLYEYVSYWDGTTCDGQCLIDDIQSALSDLKE